MNVYVASSWRNEHQQYIVDVLRKAGHEVYDFKHPATGNAGFHWSEIDRNWKDWSTQQYREALKHEYAQFGFNRDFDAMKDADACVLVLPCGRSAHIEAGWMKGAGNKVIAYIPEGIRIEPELMYGLLDGITSDIQELLSWLKSVVDTKFELCNYPEQVLKIGRDFQNKDGFRGAHYDTVKLLCDTIEYQQEQLKTKTEVGDCAKLREAAATVYDVLEKLRPFSLHLGDVGRMREFSHLICLAKNRLDAAIAAPPRNCDTPYNDSVEMYGAFKDWCNARGHTMEPKLAYDAFEWLLAHATEKEGENDEQK